ncbi:unnamed protein product [Calypogeia fissa]
MGSEAVVPSPPITFHLTGFKKFHNVTDNPTEVLVRTLRDYLKHRVLPFGATIGSCTVLEAAGAGILEFVLDLLGSATTATTTKKNSDEINEGEQLESVPEKSGEAQGQPEVVWVHFGVNSGASRFAVEQRAVNEATFRCPDEMGWQPDGMPIVVEDGAISNVRETKLPTSKIVAELVKSGFDAVVSYDAGRFVCNYLYYQSLRHAANHGTKCIFVHVPPFTVIHGQIQMEFIAALLKIVATSLA